MKRTAAEWSEFCQRHITAGYVPAHDKAGMFQRSCDSMAQLRALDLWQPGDVILDIGCANGRIAMGLLDEPITYIGLDIVPGCIEFCELAFAENDNYQFVHLDVYNGRYNRNGTIAPQQAIFPLDAASVDVAIASSLFTHLGTLDVARHYMDEICRVLKSGGQFFNSWFRSPPNEVSEAESRTAYREIDIREMLAGRFTMRYSARGNTTAPHDQWAIVAVKK